MKKFFVLFMLITESLNIHSQYYNSVVVNMSDGNKTTVLTNDIDSITYSDFNTQNIWTKDSVYRTSLSLINNTSFEYFNFYENVFIKTENIGSWSEMRIAYDGSLMMIKNGKNENCPEDLLVVLPSYELGLLYSYTKFDEYGMPKSITMNECIIFIDAYYDNYIDMTIAYNDSIAYSVDSLTLMPSNSRGSKVVTRSWKENNWQRNLAGCLEVLSGIAGISIGSLLVTGSVVSEAGSFGASSPISIPGIMAGTLTIAGGVSTFASGWDTLLTAGESRSNVGDAIYYQLAGEMIANGPQNAYVPEKYIYYMKDPNYSQQLSKAGWIDFFVGLSTDLIDNLYGKTVTWENTRQYYQNKVITGLNKDITTSSATVRGYVSPTITKSLMDGSKIDNEYGIVIYSTIDNQEKYIQKEINGDGGNIEFAISNLKAATTYNYVTYYIDKTNGISLLGKTKSFRTASMQIAQIEQVSAKSDGYGKLKFKANVRLNAIDKGIEGTVSYGFGIYRDGERVYEYLINSFDEVKEIELDCDTSNLMLDMDNYEASTEGHWTIALSVQYDYEGTRFITYFTDEMQDIILTYKQKPSLTFTKATLGNTTVDKDEKGNPDRCHTEIFADYIATGTFWVNTVDLVVIQGTAEDGVGYWDVINDGEQTFWTYYHYPYDGDNDCAFKFDFVLSNGKRVSSSNVVKVWGSPTITGIDVVNIANSSRSADSSYDNTKKTSKKNNVRPIFTLNPK